MGVNSEYNGVSILKISTICPRQPACKMPPSKTEVLLQKPQNGDVFILGGRNWYKEEVLRHGEVDSRKIFLHSSVQKSLDYHRIVND